MISFSQVTSLNSAEEALAHGDLIRVQLLPVELGGTDVPENIVYIPPSAKEDKDKSTSMLLKAIQDGMNQINIVPKYSGSSFVPNKISITAAALGAPPEFRVEVDIW